MTELEMKNAINRVAQDMLNKYQVFKTFTSIGETESNYNTSNLLINIQCELDNYYRTFKGCFSPEFEDAIKTVVEEKNYYDMDTNHVKIFNSELIEVCRIRKGHQECLDDTFSEIEALGIKDVSYIVPYSDIASKNGCLYAMSRNGNSGYNLSKCIVQNTGRLILLDA